MPTPRAAARAAPTSFRPPDVLRSNGHPTGYQRWHVVWEHEVTPTNHDIRGRRVDADGVMPEGVFSVASSVLDERNPSATSASIAFYGVRPWMVAYQIQSGANGWDIRCNSIHPVFTQTPMVETFITAASDPARMRAGLEAAVPLGRLGQPEEVAAMAVYLASEEAKFVTGAEFVIDGGLTAA